MNIHTFEKHFNKIILQRGYDYFINEYVIDVIAIDEHNWQAEVEGSELYTVNVEIEENGHITYVDCDCPYDNDCKHMVAVLYTIQEQFNKPPLVSQKQQSTLQQLLVAQSKENLINLILTVGKSTPQFLKELEIHLMKPTDIIAASEKLIVHHLRAEQDRHDNFIPQHRATKALKGIYTTIHQAEEQLDNGDYLTAIELSFLCLQYTIEAGQYGDDFYGDFSQALDNSIAVINGAIQDGVEIWTKGQYENVYQLVIQKAMQPILEDWAEYRISLLHACIPLCADDAIEEQFKTLLQSLEGTVGSSHNNRLLQIKLHLLETKYSQKEVEAFLEQHISNAEMRDQLIQSAMTRGDYEKVLHLTTDGMKQHQLSLKNLRKWQNNAFIAHKHLGHTEEMRQLALQLLLNGDYDFYRELKALYTVEQWPEALEELLDHLINSYLYPKLIVEEQHTARILAYCQEQPQRIIQYYPHIKESYYEEVCALFIDTITAEAKIASNRKRYQDVCYSINKMRQAGYSVEAGQLIKDLLQTYPKRRAFIEELKYIQK
ncbi:SWIM zinc finger family protein [Lysinibacillus sp. FSL H8-0500]|uniref:SWIM zinc finger family protein n=1 Tax=Lysinibacillus sp. FSL H8-0500 TaxID=2921393 RepID=UPI003100F004